MKIDTRSVDLSSETVQMAIDEDQELEYHHSSEHGRIRG